MPFHIGDMISTIVILAIFVTMFFFMIMMTKKVKSNPPKETLQRLNKLAIRVKQLEGQVQKLSGRR